MTPTWLLAGLIHLVEASEGGIAFLAHVALENSRCRLAQIDDDEPIDDVGKFSVEIEAHQFAAEFCVLADENRKPFAVLFDIGDGLREFVEIVQRVAERPSIPAPEFRTSKWSARMN